jgi:hypothetical protein
MQLAYLIAEFDLDNWESFTFRLFTAAFILQMKGFKVLCTTYLYLLLLIQLFQTAQLAALNLKCRRSRSVGDL